jgi:hypothetical protein
LDQRKESVSNFSTQLLPHNIREEFLRFALVPENKALPVTKRAAMFNERFGVDFDYRIYRNLLVENNFSFRKIRISNINSRKNTV